MRSDPDLKSRHRADLHDLFMGDAEEELIFKSFLDYFLKQIFMKHFCSGRILFIFIT